MITVISATNRENSNTKIVSEACVQLLEKQGVESTIFSLRDFSLDRGEKNEYGTIPESFKQIFSTYIDSVDRFIFVLPEYNGSFPGIAKLFLDILPPSIWEGKKSALIGVASGRAGNIRGLDHFGAILNYLKVEVLSSKIPLSSIHDHINDQGKLDSPEYLPLLEGQIKKFLDI